MSKPKLKYSDTKLVKRKNKGKTKGFLVFIFCLVCVFAVILVSGGLGDVLKVNTFSFLFGGSGSVINSHSYYAVLMGEYSSQSEAQAVASGVSVMGAGAYVWETNGTFLVVGNVYESKSDAETVLKNISGNNYNVSIKELNFSKLNLKTDALSTEQTQIVINAIKFLDDVYKQCYDYSIKFDKGEIVATVVSSELNTLKGEAKIWASKLDAINSYAVTNQGILTKNAYISVVGELEAGVLKVIDGTSVNKDLKYLTTSVAIIKLNLYNAISSL